MKKIFRSIPVALLTWEAKLALKRHAPKIVAVTGNLGKTSTKDAIFAAVEPFFKARKSEKSFNSDIGVPLAILGLSNPWSNPFRWVVTLVHGYARARAKEFPQLLILEVGADQPGDIAAIATWLHPDIAVYTGVPEIPVHIANFGSRDVLVAEKRTLLVAVKPGGFVMANRESGGEEALNNLGAQVIACGLDASCDVRATGVRVRMNDALPVGMEAQIQTREANAPLVISGALGTPVIRSALAAVAVARALGVSVPDAARALSAWKPAPGRMRVLRGIKGSTVIDDSYNSSPAAALSALDTLQQIPGTRKIAVLGDMRELGQWSERAHTQVGQHAAGIVDFLVTVGEESRVLAATAHAAGLSATQIRSYGYGESERAGKELAREVGAGDVILIKGSQNKIRLENAVKELLADSSQAPSLLVRHEAAWRRR